MHAIDELNEAQRAAVTAPEAPRMVLAGAGSGKTRVLVHRLAWLQEHHGIPAHGLLAVTFTNKAAREMRERVLGLTGGAGRGLFLGTFHGLAHRFLRKHGQQAGLPEDFRILDSEDQQRVIKQVLGELRLDETKWPPRRAQWFINAQKDEARRPGDVEAADAYAEQMVAIYRAYDEAIHRQGLVDFAELLLASYSLFGRDDALRDHYQRRFAHLLVDEFQDTNTLQYLWLRRLAGDRGQPFVVGDDDQSIYGWRGARVENMQRFLQDYPNAEVIRLEQNYRSTGCILEAANALIERNPDRLGKQLWTALGAGEPIRLYAAVNEQDEAAFVVGRIQAWQAAGHGLDTVGVLYRSNAQSRAIEEALFRTGIPYRVYGGLRFFDRAEIKDALSYLRLIANPDDDAALERVINQPPRGIGEKTLQSIREAADAAGTSRWRALTTLLEANRLSGRARNAVSAFRDRVEELRVQEGAGHPLGDWVDAVLEGSGLRGYFERDTSEAARSRLENLDELITAARAYEAEFAEDEWATTPLLGFLANAALEGSDDRDETTPRVQLMTLHAAKGLEFPMVCVTGLEENLFPHAMSITEDNRLAEERRLCYVGLTRAQEALYLTYAERRRLHGQEHANLPSRFLDELPASVVEIIKPRHRVTSTRYAPPPEDEPPGSTGVADSSDAPWPVGQRVVHKKFGLGRVTGYEGEGAHTRVHVNFDQHGRKCLVLGYAKLEPLTTGS